MSLFLKLIVFCSAESQSETEGAVKIVVQLQKNRVGNCWAWTLLRKWLLICQISRERSTRQGIWFFMYYKGSWSPFFYSATFSLCVEENWVLYLIPCVSLASSGWLYFFWCLFWEIGKFPLISSPGLSVRDAGCVLDALTVIDAGMYNMYSISKASHARLEQKRPFYRGKAVRFLKKQIFQVLFLLLLEHYSSSQEACSDLKPPCVCDQFTLISSQLPQVSPFLLSSFSSSWIHDIFSESHKVSFCDSAPPVLLFVQSSPSLPWLYVQGRLRPRMMSLMLP